MKRLLMLTLFLCVLVGCEDGFDFGTDPIDTEPDLTAPNGADVDASNDESDLSVSNDTIISPCIDQRTLEAITELKPAADWELLATLPRNNLHPYHFRMVAEFTEPIMGAYLAGKDFLFVIYKPTFNRQRHFYFDQPEPPAVPKNFDKWGAPEPGEPASSRVLHFPDPDADWFQYWGNPAFQDRTIAGFTVKFNVLFVDSVEFGTSLDGWGVGGPGAPEIRQDFELKIYAR